MKPLPGQMPLFDMPLHTAACEDCGTYVLMDDPEWYDGPVCQACHESRTSEGSKTCRECGFYIWT